MIKTEQREINGKEFVYNYSDEGYKIRKIGTDEIYEDVYDLPDMGYEYEETDELIDKQDDRADT